jgi:hypothetical protein
MSRNDIFLAALNIQFDDIDLPQATFRNECRQSLRRKLLDAIAAIAEVVYIVVASGDLIAPIGHRKHSVPVVRSKAVEEGDIVVMSLANRNILVEVLIP